jgi:hypothetical protein
MAKNNKNIKKSCFKPENFTAKQKEIKKLMTDFVKNLTGHLTKKVKEVENKTGHKYTLEIINKLITPL